MKLVSFIVRDSVLYVHIPVFLKLKNQPVLDLYRVRSFPIPYEPAEIKPNADGEWIGPYTKVKIEKEYLAIGENVYLALSKRELDLCKTIAGRYYCEHILLMKHVNEHTCTSAIFQSKSDLVPKLCNVTYMAQYYPNPLVVESQNYLLMIGMPSPWKIYCDKALGIPTPIKESALAIIPREEICNCDFSAKNYFIHENILSCKPNGKIDPRNIKIFYTVNAPSIDYFHKLMSDVVETNGNIELEIRRAD